MRKGYEKPCIEFEEYAIVDAIASNCGTIVDLGPGDGEHEVCNSYIGGADLGSLLPGADLMTDPSHQNFYKESCSCYLSAGGGTVFTS